MRPSAPLAAPGSFQPDVVLDPEEQIEPSLPLGSDGVRRWVWHSRHGAILIEAVGSDVFVNGERVEPHAP